MDRGIGWRAALLSGRLWGSWNLRFGRGGLSSVRGGGVPRSHDVESKKLSGFVCGIRS